MLAALGAPAIVTAIVVVCCAGFIQAVTGFGFALLAVPLLALVIAPRTAVVVVFLLSCCSSVLTASANRTAINWREARPLTIGAYIAMPLGVLVLLNAPASVLRAALGIVTCAVAVWLLLPRRNRPPRRGTAFAYVAGAASGVLNTSLSTNGPPLVAYLRTRHLGVAEFRATISTVLAASNVGGLLMLLVGRAIHLVAVEYFGIAVASGVAGWVAGQRVAGRLAAHHFARAVDLLLLVSGLLALGRAFVH